jgi:predicted nucleic acid-binding protein
LREYASKLEDPEARKQVQVYVDASLAIRLVDKKQTDQALELVHKGELNQLLKAWVLTECAKQLVKTDRDQALELIDEAATEARRIDVSDPSLPRALIAVAYALNVIDRERVWDATFDAVKAANSAEGFTGEDGEIVAKFQSKGHSSVHTNDVPEFDLDGIFRDLALQDYDRAVELARGFQAEGPRAVATIAIARAILEPPKKK